MTGSQKGRSQFTLDLRIFPALQVNFSGPTSPSCFIPEAGAIQLGPEMCCWSAFGQVQKMIKISQNYPFHEQTISVLTLDFCGIFIVVMQAIHVETKTFLEAYRPSMMNVSPET